MPLSILGAGAAGRMGRRIVSLGAADPELELAGAVEAAGHAAVGKDVGERAGVGKLGVAVMDKAPEKAGCIIDFSLPAGTAAVAAFAAKNGIPLVTGTTGLGSDEQAALEAAAKKIPVLAAPNMSTGVNVLLELVEGAARVLGGEYEVEIVEAHHNRKADAPSGTALRLAERVAEARGQELEKVRVDGRKGRPGPRRPEEIGLHALRRGGVVGEHSVCFASREEVLTLSHRAESRDAFAAGAVRAAKWLVGKSPGSYTMRQVLGL